MPVVLYKTWAHNNLHNPWCRDNSTGEPLRVLLSEPAHAPSLHQAMWHNENELKQYSRYERLLHPEVKSSVLQLINDGKLGVDCVSGYEDGQIGCRTSTRTTLYDDERMRKIPTYQIDNQEVRMIVGAPVVFWHIPSHAEYKLPDRAASIHAPALLQPVPYHASALSTTKRIKRKRNDQAGSATAESKAASSSSTVNTHQKQQKRQQKQQLRPSTRTFTTEYIIKHRKTNDKNGYEFFVKWQDYSDDASSWEPSSYLIHNIDVKKYVNASKDTELKEWFKKHSR